MHCRDGVKLSLIGRQRLLAFCAATALWLKVVTGLWQLAESTLIPFVSTVVPIPAHELITIKMKTSQVRHARLYRIQKDTSRQDGWRPQGGSHCRNRELLREERTREPPKLRSAGDLQ